MSEAEHRWEMTSVSTFPGLLWRCTCGNQEFGAADTPPPPCAWEAIDRRRRTQPAPDDRRWWLWRLGPLAAWHVGDPPASARRHPALEMVAVRPAPVPEEEEQ